MIILGMVNSVAVTWQIGTRCCRVPCVRCVMVDSCDYMALLDLRHVQCSTLLKWSVWCHHTMLLFIVVDMQTDGALSAAGCTCVGG
jgi:hypothetical protein